MFYQMGCAHTDRNTTTSPRSLWNVVVENIALFLKCASARLGFSGLVSKYNTFKIPILQNKYVVVGFSQPDTFSMIIIGIMNQIRRARRASRRSKTNLLFDTIPGIQCR